MTAPAGDHGFGRRVPLWLDTALRPDPRPALTGELDTDLLIVGGGFAGLWTAVRAKERNPARHVVLVEKDRIAEHATGRNGGFCEASLTHGEANGRARWPEDYATLHRLGLENLQAIGATIQRYGIDCGFTDDGLLSVATREHEVDASNPSRAGWFSADAVRVLVDSPTYLAGRFEQHGCALVDPARLAWGLATVAESLGVTIAENTQVISMKRRGDSVLVHTTDGSVRARRVALGTNVFPSLLRRLRLHTVPVYDYVLATEPLTAQQHRSIGWHDNYGIVDSGNQFHYYRRTPDNRILFGGYEAIYHYGRRVRPDLEDRPDVYTLLGQHFHQTFPTLADVRFSHAWAGAIDTCSRFCAFFGTAAQGRIAYALGFTGLGVGATRFAADVMLDLLDGVDSERTRLTMVRTRPLPFPPEPLAWIGIQATRRALARADHTGRRNVWLRSLDRLGLGFDS